MVSDDSGPSRVGELAHRIASRGNRATPAVRQNPEDRPPPTRWERIIGWFHRPASAIAVGAVMIPSGLYGLAQEQDDLGQFRSALFLVWGPYLIWNALRRERRVGAASRSPCESAPVAQRLMFRALLLVASLVVVVAFARRSPRSSTA